MTRNFALYNEMLALFTGDARRCQHFIKVDVFGRKCVLCACRYDNTKAKEAQECKNTDKKD